jgi:hypothetical protein
VPVLVAGELRPFIRHQLVEKPSQQFSWSATTRQSSAGPRSSRPHSSRVHRRSCYPWERPACRRHRPFGIAGDWHRLSCLVRAPHRCLQRLAGGRWRLVHDIYCSRGELRLHERGSLDPTTGDETAILLLQTFASFKTPVPPDECPFLGVRARASLVREGGSVTCMRSSCGNITGPPRTPRAIRSGC